VPKWWLPDGFIVLVCFSLLWQLTPAVKPPSISADGAGPLGFRQFFPGG
jgi:hypothetical protein